MSNIYPEGIDIAAEVEEFVRSDSKGKVSRKGDEYIFETCPFCKGGSSHEKNKFSINIKTGQYKCQRSKCNAEGNLWTLTKDPTIYYSLPEPEKKENRKHTHSFRVSEDHDERAAKWVKENRGIPEEVTYKYRLAFGTDKFKNIYNKDGNKIISKPENVLVWQFTNPSGNKTLWYKFRKTEGNGPKEWSISKDFELGGKKYHVEPCLFGMGECDYKESYVIMTEGQFDTLAVAAAGYGNVVSVPTGANGFAWFDDNEESKDFLKRFDTLIIFGDREGDKITLLEEMSTRFNGRIKHVRVEDYKDCKDANDILRKYGAEQIRQCIDNAEELEIEHLKKMKDIKRVNKSELPRIKTGIGALDEQLLGFFFGQVITLTGRSGDGKTTLASQFVACALEQHVPTVIYSGEIPDWMVKEWLVLQLAGPNNLEICGKGTDVRLEIYEKIERWEPFSENCYVYSVDDLDINDNEDDSKSLLDTVKQAILRAGVKFIIIDNLMTAMTFSEEGDLNKTQSSFMKQLKYIAKTFEVIILLVAHPKKAPSKRDQTITKEDIAGSSNIGNLSDTIISYSRPSTEQEYQRELCILKNRWNNDRGVGGDPICLYFEEHSKRIAESKDFSWVYEWNEDWESVENLEEIPF